jgi:hypothetical protein
MDAATQSETAKLRLATFLAGLEGGTVGVLWMLAWLGVSSVWQQRSFWAPENLMATAFDRNSTWRRFLPGHVRRPGAVRADLQRARRGILVGGARSRAARRVMLLAVIFAVAWYYFSFRWTSS